MNGQVWTEALPLCGVRVQTTQQEKKYSFQVYGHSLAGFELPEPTQQAEDVESHSHYYDLEEQISFVQGKLNGFLSEYTGSIERTSGAEPVATPKVILIGHSVGAYIAMEVLRRHRENSMNGDRPVEFDIVGGVMLFPTVVDIAKSPSGQKLTRLISLIPQLAIVAGVLVRILTTLLPTVLLQRLIKLNMASAPASMVDTTAAFLKSQRGVRQALHMAADEMQTITSDQWSDDVWGISTTKDPVTRLFFYFGRNDHWVAEHTRDAIIEHRGRVRGGPEMIICEDGLPHAFCIRHSDIVATKVADMVMDIMN
ncbi:bifunctional triacylglycerol lipase/ester hydrolase [Aspergillus tanneri]|uniref:AB hydrolase-1 domain-containing protein n=1 Tax=Aspergillus tanneri TaxID=1220188 RepID=A0A5M9M8A5_9EURO|nr:uncharacterized protein ATNIH1004_010765 [Aspergillus tanneri]KAA8641826.1 hypothetical protein ATNIH1004_010765 [Aspergillus tanneri]